MPLITRTEYNLKKEMFITFTYMYKVINDFYYKIEKSEKYMNETKKESISEKISKKFKREIKIELVQLFTYFLLGVVSLSMFIVSIVSYNIIKLDSILMIINIILSLVVIVMIITLFK